MIADCPYCGRTLECPDEYTGMEADCPHCGAPVVCAAGVALEVVGREELPAFDYGDIKAAWQLQRINLIFSAPGRRPPPGIVNHAFFSARVCEARILGRLRSEVDDYVTGKVNRDRAIANLQAFLRGEGYVTGEGLGPPPGVSEEDWVRSRNLANLAATSRLGLILDVNLREANAVRRHAEMRESGAPYLRYEASYKKNKRPDHLKLVGMVLPADHPFWRGFPRDYRCGCSYEEVWDDGEAAESGGAGVAVRRPDGGWEFERGGQKIVSPPNPSGFEFDAGEAFASVGRRTARLTCRY
ncbi:MAG: hypothetical protein PHI85_03945 [Victivallaceae bacterium]|nr:hypothetical protein [Victivallaceae bacterium]